MLVIEKLKEHPVDDKPCYLTLFAEGGVIQHLEDKSVILGKWKVLKTHGWQTGTPTEEGWYLIAIRFCNRIEYEARECRRTIDNNGNECMRFDGCNTVIAWQKIEPYEEDSE